MGKFPRIDPDALYTEEQCARFLVETEPNLTIEQAREQIRHAIKSGDLKIAGYLRDG